jgi:hypothetical protein
MSSEMTYFQMQLASGQNHMLASLLLEGLNTWIGLTEELKTGDELGHVRWRNCLQRYSHNGRTLSV